MNLEPIGMVSGHVRIGIEDFRLRSGPRTSFLGVAGDTDIAIKVGQRIRLRATYARDVQFSAWFGYAYFIENRIGTGASFYPFHKIRLDYDYLAGKNSYPLGSLTGEGPDTARTDNNRTHRVGIYYRIKNRIGLGLTLNWWHRDSTLAQINGKRIFIGANLIYDF